MTLRCFLESPRRHHHAVAILGALLWLSTLWGCGEATPPPAPDVYECRGVVRQLPAAGAAKPEIYIQHEAIAEFRDANGKVVGMESMAMPFPIEPSMPWQALQVGDKIAFTFEVQWQEGHPLRMTEWQVLDADTRLGFELPPEAP